MTEVLFVLLMTAMACGLLGPFLVLRRLSMTADALSHSVLLGIVLAFFLVRSLDSVLLTLGAALFGLLTVLAVELLSGKGLVKRDDALGLVFPMFFSLGVLLITRFFRNVHLDIEIVLMGDPLFAPFVRLFGLPRSLVEMFLLFLLNLSFVILFYEPLKISTFDPSYAFLLGIPVKRIFYALMILCSFCCVTAFNSVGAILVISFFAASAAAASLLSRSLWQMILLTLLLGALNCLIGCLIAFRWNVSISGMCSFVGMLSVLLLSLFSRGGILRGMRRRKQQRERFKEELLLLHLYRHRGDREETGFESLFRHVNWSRRETERYIGRLMKMKWVFADPCDKIYKLTEEGRERLLLAMTA